MDRSKILREKFEETLEMISQKKDVNTVISNLKQIIGDQKLIGGSYEVLKIKEKCIYRLGETFSALGKKKALIELSKHVRPIFGVLPVVVSAKIVKTLIEQLGKIPNSMVEQIELCKESTAWAIKEKRTFLKQRIQTKLATLYYAKKDYENSIKILTKLVREVRKLDDKELLVMIFLLESKVQFSLKNNPKAKSALIAARNAGESIYIKPELQGDLDTQSGIIFAADGDYETSFSYFFEAFESYHNMGKTLALYCLKYMLLCKILAGNPEELLNILANKNTLSYGQSREILSIRAVASAYQHESLHEFEDALKKYDRELVKDFIISQKIDNLYEDLLEKHLLKIIKPYSRVQISHVAKTIKLDKKKIERKLSLMILDKKFNGILDQGSDCLITFDDNESDEMLRTSSEILDKCSTIVDALFDKAKKLES